MKTQHFAALLGLALTLVGAVFMFTSVTRDGINCGTAFHDSGSATYADSVNGYTGALTGVGGQAHIAADCDSARATRATLTLALGIPGLVLLLGGGVAVLSARGEFTRPPSYRDIDG